MKRTGPAEPAGGATGGEHVVGQDAFESVGDGGGVGRIDKQPRIADHLRQCAPVRGHDRHADRHGLERRQSEALVERGQHQHPRTGEQRPQRRRVQIPGTPHAAGQRRACRALQPVVRAAPPGQNQVRHARRARDEPCVGVEKAGDVLAGCDSSHEEHVSDRRRSVPRRPVGRPVRADGDRLGGNVQPAFDLGRGVPGGHDDVRRTCGMTADQRGVVPAHLAGRAVRVIEEVQIVNRDDLRRAARRHQQRVRRVHDVESPAGYRFYRRPPGPVPGQIEQPNRYAAVDGADGGGHRRLGMGRRSFQDALKTVSSRGSRGAVASHSSPARAATRWCTNAPTPVGRRNAGR